MRVVVGWRAICIKILKTIDNKQRLSTSATTQVNEGGQIYTFIFTGFKTAPNPIVRPGDTPRELTKASVLLLLALLLTLLLLLGAPRHWQPALERGEGQVVVLVARARRGPWQGSGCG